jgi:glutamyl-tRNA reductase
VPRDVDPQVNEIDGVYLYDIDALEAIAEQGRSKRMVQVEKCERIIAAEIEAWDFPEAGYSGSLGKEGDDGDLSDLSPAHE